LPIDDRHSLAKVPLTVLSFLYRLCSVVSSQGFLMATASSPTSAVSRHRLTVSAYERMADAGIIGPGVRVELINGEILDMSPIGSLHAAVVSRLARDFIVAAREAAIVRVQDPLRLDDFNEPEPDLAILTPRENFYASCHPGPRDTLLVVEVADTSLDHDMTTKAAIYAGAGIREYWVVDLSSHSVAILSDPRDGFYETRRTHRGGEPLEPAGLPGCLVDPLAMLRRL
jgi:Uma2 family endonuclease